MYAINVLLNLNNVYTDMSMISEARGPIVHTSCVSDPDCSHHPCASCGCKCINRCCACHSNPYFSENFCWV